MNEEAENLPGHCVRDPLQWDPDVNLAEHLIYRHVAEGRGGNVAVLYGEHRLSYAELAQMVRCSSVLFRRLGVTGGDRVVLVLPDTPAFVAAFFGILAVGGVAVPVNPAQLASDVAYVISRTDPKAVVIDSMLADKFREVHSTLGSACLLAGDGIVRMDDFEDRLNSAPAEEPIFRQPDGLAYCAFSSGTTGRPKGIPHLHADILHCAAAYAAPVLGMSYRDRVLAVPKLCFGYGLGGNLLCSFVFGGTAILIPEVSTAGTIVSALAQHRPTLLLSSPRMLSEILQLQPRPALGGLRVIVSAGEVLSPSLYDRWKAAYDVEVLDGFGSTEMGHIFISNRIGEVRKGSAGRILPGFEVRLVDDEFEPVPTGTVGQMLARGKSSAAYYWNDQQKTNEQIRDGWITTGDLFRQDAAGYLYACGRADDMIKAGCGHWVSPHEIEQVLLSHPAVVDCAVVGSSDADGLVRPKAYVVLKRGTRPTVSLQEDVKDLVRTTWPELDYKHLGAVDFVSVLPRSPTGKLQRSSLSPNTMTEYSYGC